MTLIRTATLLSLLVLVACAGKRPEMQTVDYVDIERFMGEWYVIANIPTFLEKGAHNAVETYTLDDDGSIATHFRFREDAFDGDLEEFNPRGFIKDEESNALWGMRFIWPIKADYRIVYLNEDYTQTIIGRQKRDYVWVMARSPQISAADYERLLDYVRSLGYDMSKVQRVPQQWPEVSAAEGDRP
ncbi:MAG: lipocalin family protein [Gammaproteobacteria bacterium]|nr:lipocalin family protein [Gammaproteobacteria bacterium]